MTRCMGLGALVKVAVAACLALTALTACQQAPVAETSRLCPDERDLAGMLGRYKAQLHQGRAHDAARTGHAFVQRVNLLTAMPTCIDPEGVRYYQALARQVGSQPLPPMTREDTRPQEPIHVMTPNGGFFMIPPAMPGHPWMVM